MRRPGILLTIALAWTGVVAGHLVSYLLTYPTEGLRHSHLLITGHTWLGLATASALGLVPVILLVAGVQAFRRREPNYAGALVGRLVAIQIPAFMFIEVVERGGSLGQALSDPAVFLGLVLQPVVAVVAVVLLEVFSRGVRAVASRLRRARLRPPRTVFPTGGRSVPTSLSSFVSARRRAPPPLLPF